MVAVLIKKKPKRELPIPGQFRIDGVSWKAYRQISDALGERHLRITYDNGSLELMTHSPEHEELIRLLDLLVFALADELDKKIKGRRSMTFDRPDLKKGLQPDDCYWLQNEKKVRNIRKYDPERHAPPDLVLEVDVTSSSMDRMESYEKMRVGEVWRWKADALQVYCLNKKGKLTRRAASTIFPGFKPADLLQFIEIAYTEGEIEMVRQFRKWVRERIADGSLKSND